MDQVEAYFNKIGKVQFVENRAKKLLLFLFNVEKIIQSQIKRIIGL